MERSFFTAKKQKEIPGTKVIASGTDTLAGESIDWFMYEWIDGDRALWADPLMEFPFHSFMSLSDRWLQTYNRQFDRNGASVERTGTFAQVRSAWYDLYLALVMVIETVYRHYPEGHDSWAREMGSSGITRLEKLLL